MTMNVNLHLGEELRTGHRILPKVTIPPSVVVNITNDVGVCVQEISIFTDSEDFLLQIENAISAARKELIKKKIEFWDEQSLKTPEE